MTKRIISLFIILALTVSLFVFSVPASAQTLPAVSVTDEDIALSTKLETLGVITNEFDIGGYATRGQMASIVARYIMASDSSTKCFADVTEDSPYFGAVGALYNMGIISGDGSGNYNPDEYVTYDQAIVYIINAIGHKPFALREGGYPTGYYRVALGHGMLSDLSMKKGTDKASIADIYKLLDKGLTAATLETVYYGDGRISYTLSDSETFLYAMYKVRKFRGTVTATETTRLTSTTSNVGEGQIEIDGKKYSASGYENQNLLGRTVDFYISTRESDVILYIEETPGFNKTFRIDAEDIISGKTTSQKIYYKDEENDEDHINLKTTADIIYNDQCTYGELEFLLPAAGYVEALDNNRDGVYDVLFIYNYKNIVVGTIDSYNDTVTDKLTGEKYNLASSSRRTTVIRFINQTRKIGLESIKPGDVLSIAESKLEPKVINIYVSREVVSGMLEGIDEDKYYISGNWYKKSADCKDSLELGITGDFYLDMNSDIVYFEQGSQGGDSKLAVMAALGHETKGRKHKITVRLYTEDEEFIEADLAEKVKINDKRKDLTKDEEVTFVLDAIGTKSGEEYTVNSAYVVKYKLNSDGLVSYLDLGGIGGPGALNTIVSAGSEMLVRPNYIMVHDGTRTRYNTAGKIFYAPKDGNLDKLDEYGIFKEFKTNHYYDNNPDLNYTDLESYAVYTFDESVIPLADVMLFRGMGAQGVVGAKSNISVVTKTTTAVNADGETAVKIYFGQTGFITASQITWTKNGSKPEKVTISSIASQLTPGTAIQYATNNKGEIAAIKAIADFDGKDLIPTFKNKDTFIQDSYDGDSDERNIIVGKVLLNDPKTNLLTFEAGGKEYLLYTSGTNVSIYRNGEKILTDADIAELVTGDIFVCRTETYYVAKDMVVYR